MTAENAAKVASLYGLKSLMLVPTGLGSPDCFAVGSQGFVFVLCSLLSWWKPSSCSCPNAGYHKAAPSRLQRTVFPSQGNWYCFVPTYKDLLRVETQGLSV